MSCEIDDPVPDKAGDNDAAAPPVGSARIAELRAAIAAGTYVIDPDAVATALLAAGALGDEETA